MAKFLGIDYGTKRIGLATGDSEVKLASPHGAVATVDELAAFVKREGPFEAVILGRPRTLDGKDTPQTVNVYHWADDVLWRKLGIEAVFQDEAATSAMAEERLKEAGKPYAKPDIDAEAAAIILQDYLDAL